MQLSDVKFWGRLYLKRVIYQMRVRRGYRRRIVKAPPSTLLILCQARSGSSLVTSYLRSIPDLHVPGEVLNPWLFIGMRRLGVGKKQALRHIRYSLHYKEATVSAAKLIDSQLLRYKLTPMDLINAFPDSQVLMVYRRQIGRQFVSLLRAQESQQWLKKAGGESNESKVKVNRSEFEFYAENSSQFYANVVANVPKNRLCIVAYEELLDDPQRVFDETVCPFLKIKSAPITTPLKKQNVQPLNQVVDNYHEVEDLLAKELVMEMPCTL